MKIFTIGRKDADIVLTDQQQQVSRLHAELTIADDGSYYLTDCGSSNGTFVNGKSLTQKRQQTLREGDVISVPGYEIELGAGLPIASAHQSQHLKASPQIETTVTGWSRSFTVWEMVVIAAAIASFALILYYVAR